MNPCENRKIRHKNPVKIFLRLLALLAWAVIILWLSLTPSPPQLPGVLGWDKLQHAGAYGLLCLLIAQFLLGVCHDAPASIWWHAGVAALCYGGLLEVLQLLADTGRSAEWWDLLADAFGVLLACLIFRQVSAARPSRRGD